MNKKIIIIIAIVLVLSIVGVSAFVIIGKNKKVDASCVAGNVIEVPDSELNQLDSIQWVSDDTSIINIIDGKPVGVSVGIASITAMNGDKKIEDYKIEITPSPIESIKLWSERVAYVGVPTVVEYKITPVEAENSGVIITTDNENIAIIEDGNIKGISAGKVNLILSNGSGYEKSFEIEVVDSPYALLTEVEKEFVDDFKAKRTYYWFKDPENLQVLAIEKLSDGWAINYHESDGTEKTMIWSDSGSVDWYDELYAKHNSAYDLEKINKALDEVYINTKN